MQMDEIDIRTGLSRDDKRDRTAEDRGSVHC
jgi:hypothetical protein